MCPFVISGAKTGGLALAMGGQKKKKAKKKKGGGEEEEEEEKDWRFGSGAVFSPWRSSKLQVKPLLPLWMWNWSEKEKR